MVVQKRTSSEAVLGDKELAKPANSLLKTSEVSFPRGGASALTPLEVKQVANEAARDVLFESQHDKGHGDDGDGVPKKKKRKIKKAGSKTASSSKGIDDEKITVDHLSFRNVTPGSYVLGQVQQINKYDVALALPDNLVGYIPLENISAEVVKQVEKYEESDGENSDDEPEDEEPEAEGPEDGFPEISKLVKVGQWLRALVVEPSQRKTKKKKNSKRIELSVDPMVVNDVLEDGDLVVGQTVQASVKSVEAHGLVVNIGKHELTGFVSKKELGNGGYDMKQVAVGAVFLLIVAKKPANSRVVSLKLSGAKPHEAVEKISSLDAVVPGNIVEAIVNSVGHHGMTCKVFGTIPASMNLPNANVYSLNGLKDRFEIGSKVKVKVVASITAEGEKKLLVSMLPHVMVFKSVQSDPLEAFPVGFALDKVVVKAVDASYLYVDLGVGNVLGQVHVSRVAGGKDSINAKYFVGSHHKAKVLGFNTVEHQYVLTMDPKLLEQKYIRPVDIPVGELVTGVIEKVSGSEGIVLKVFDTFEAFVHPKHVSDIKLVYPERKYKVGSKVKARILKITARAKVLATLKKSLVNLSDKTLLTDYKTIAVGTRSAGTVEAIFPNGAVVSFFGNVRGFLPKSEISETFVKNPQDYLRVAHTIAVSVLMVDVNTRKMTVSCKTTSTSDSLAGLQVGKSIVAATVVEKTKDSVVATVDEAKGIIYSSQLSDGNYEQNRQLFKSIKVGDTLETVVLEKNKKAKLVILSGKQSLIQDAKKNKLPVDYKAIQNLSHDVVLHGYIKSVSDKGLFVGFGGKLVGLVLKKYALKSKNDSLDDHFKQHQSVECHLLRTDDENERFLLALYNQNSNKKQITDHDSDYKLHVGNIVPAKIKSVHDSFVIVELVQRKIGFCYFTDALTNYDSTLKDVYKVKNVVNAKILSKGHKFIVSLRNNFPQVTDKQISSIEDIKQGDVLRGLVKNVNDKGVYVSLNSDLFALVRVADLSDQYLKNWKNYFKPNQVVKGRILSVKGEGRILMTLKQSQLTGKLSLTKSFDDLNVNDVFDGTVRSVTEFGVFVNLENTNGVSGLAHKSQISDDGPVENLNALFGEGDKVKVKILAVDQKKKQLSLGMKASLFEGDVEMEDSNISEASEVSDDEMDSSASDEQLDEAFAHVEDDSDDDDDDEDEKPLDTLPSLSSGLSGLSGLSTNGFDWTASILDQVDDVEEENDYDTQVNGIRTKSKSKTGKAIVEDKTADLNTRAPQSVQDFERLLIGEPNLSVLWMNYMSFQLQLSEIERAREIGQRALKTINYREEQEKLNIWIALLNLENTFGTEETLQETFKKACQYMDSLVIHQKLAGIYILSDKKDEAERLYRVMTKKFNSELGVWINFAKFLLENKKNEEAHELLAKALQVLPKTDHVEVVQKFGQFEFKIGDPEQGRSLFEGLISDKPKRIDLWNVYIDQEIKQNEKQKVEDLFERLFTKKLSNKQKKFFFTKWLQFEEAQNDEKACDYVKAKARAIAEGDN